MEYKHTAIFQPPCADTGGVFDKIRKFSESEELISDRCPNFGVFEKTEHRELRAIIGD
jgi:hypothetical protein